MFLFRCTFAFDRDTVQTFIFENDIADMEEAVGLALNRIAEDVPQSVPGELQGFSILRLDTNPPTGDFDGTTNPPNDRNE
jgi:hypothetical protein